MIKSKSIAGIAIPDSKLANEAADLLREYGAPYCGTIRTVFSSLDRCSAVRRT